MIFVFIRVFIIISRMRKYNKEVFITIKTFMKRGYGLKEIFIFIISTWVVEALSKPLATIIMPVL